MNMATNDPEKIKASRARHWAKIKDDPIVKAKNIEKTRKWYKENRERALINKKRRNSIPEVKFRRRNNAHLKLYGISLMQREALFVAQGSKCGICNTENPGLRWELDHCHKSGLIRGILCSGCNLLLGHGRDDPKVLAAAIEYLERLRPEGVTRIFVGKK
jgi:Recombination endonuclease VII